MPDLKPNEWIKLKYSGFPKNFERLIDACHRYERFKAHVLRLGTFVKAKDIVNISQHGQIILSEYLKIVREEGKTSADTIKEIVADCSRSLSLFIDEKGKFRDLTTQIGQERAHGSMDTLALQLMGPLSAFIRSRIYDSIKETLEKTEGKFVNWYVINTTRKVGIVAGIKPPEKTLKKEEEDKKK